MITGLPAKRFFFNDITVRNISQSFTHKIAAKASWQWNYMYVTVTLCIVGRQVSGVDD